MKSGGDLTLWLDSDVSADDIVAVCCFVIDEAQIAVSRGNAADAAPASGSQAAAEQEDLEALNEVAAKAPASEKTEPAAVSAAAAESRTKTSASVAVTEALEAPKAPEGDKKTKAAAAPLPRKAAPSAWAWRRSIS